jgi:PAS domain S-box-containing protein
VERPSPGTGLTHSPEDDETAEQVETILSTPDLADALESEQFRRFLDHVPIAILVSELKNRERIVYANPEFERMSGQLATGIVGRPWSVLHGHHKGEGEERKLGVAIAHSADFVGTFVIERRDEEPVFVDAYSNVIEDDDGTPSYRLAALVNVGQQAQDQREEWEQKLREKDTLLLEVQHRVKNNLQMITALLRIEARNAQGRTNRVPFDRLAGRIESVQLLYKLLSDLQQTDEIDLGIYLSDIASAVLHSYGVEGTRLDLKIDSFPVSVNVAMPTGLVVNELLTNALKHAFIGRDGGTITLQSLSDGNHCRVIVADDGIGLPEGVQWPKPGKLSALIVRSLRENAKAHLSVESSPGQGMRVTISFTRLASAPADDPD